MKRSFLFAVIASLCAASAAIATTYVRVEPDGTKTYSDRPIPGGKPVEIQPAQGYSAGPSSPLGSNRTLAPEQQSLDFKYDSCTISPMDDSTFVNPESVAISLSASPALRPFDTVVMLIDGQPAGSAGSPSFTMSPVNRGTHTISVTVTDRYGRLLCSATSSFHVQRPSLNSPARH